MSLNKYTSHTGSTVKPLLQMHVSTCRNKRGVEAAISCQRFLFSLVQAMFTNNDQFQLKLLTPVKTGSSDHACTQKLYIVVTTFTQALLRYVVNNMINGCIFHDVFIFYSSTKRFPGRLMHVTENRKPQPKGTKRRRATSLGCSRVGGTRVFAP